MVQIQASVEIDAPIDKVWDIVSDLDSEPKFWKGTKEVRNISKEGNTITREVTIAFKDSKCMQKVMLYPKQKIEVQFTKGIIEGSKTITLTQQENKTILDVLWDMKLSGMMGMFTGMIKKHIQSGTEQALQSIKQEIQR
ncbi:MAG TPA: SRPBCC family protein [Candidatus Nitrosotalea sp.]|nr:SRPBCC family protein [Candidatus Nitrosotalea sp.]